MLAYIADRMLTPSGAWGDELIESFADLARLHADGWGTAWVGSSGELAGVGGVQAFAPTDLDGSEASNVRVLYLRFASKGSPARPENTQPFVRDGLAFQHNGLLAPRDRALDLLAPADVAELVGTTDSEVYFAVVRRHLRTAGPAETGRLAAIAAAVNEVRAVFPDACLNAFVLDASGLYVVHSVGRAATPAPAFAQRGFTTDALPPGHGADYNTLRVVRGASGAFVVATTGVDEAGWDVLPADTVSKIDAAGIRSVPIEPGIAGAGIRSVSMTPSEDVDPMLDAVATLVVQVAVNKVDALAVISLAVDSAVLAAGSARPRVELDGGAWAEVDIPKFGEPPPLAIDVRSPLGLDHAQLSALGLAAALEHEAGWSVYPDFPVAAP
jgi:predicted glutamine amidotransferase